MNEQAAEVAASVLSEPVVAATRCEQITEDMNAEAAGVGKGVRGIARFDRKLAGGLAKGMGMGGLTNMGKEMRSAGLPNTFVLAVTETQVHALEDKQRDGNLVAGNILKSWDRKGLMARAGEALGVAAPDRQALTLFLPMDAGKNKYLKATAARLDQAGAPGMPTKFLVAKDAASQAVIDAIASREALNDFGATQLETNPALAARFAAAGVNGQGAGGSSSVERLEKLAQLRASGVLNDAEFEAEKAKVIAGA
jgi:hypothetical protein